MYFWRSVYFMLCVFFFGICTSGFNGNHLARERGNCKENALEHEECYYSRVTRNSFLGEVLSEFCTILMFIHWIHKSDHSCPAVASKNVEKWQYLTDWEKFKDNWVLNCLTRKIIRKKLNLDTCWLLLLQYNSLVYCILPWL